MSKVTKQRFRRKLIIASALTLVTLALLGPQGCSTATKIEPSKPPGAQEVSPPEIASLPHPTGYSQSDLLQIFRDPRAPKPDSLASCDSELKKLFAATQIKSEREQGAQELVNQDPVKYHWCFYGKLLEADQYLQGDAFIDEKQKKTLSTFDSLVPIAQVFARQYHDSRYLRWAIRDYRRISSFVFNRTLELSPQMSSELVQAEEPGGSADAAEEISQDPDASVLERYKIIEKPVAVTPPAAAPTKPAVFPAATNSDDDDEVEQVEIQKTPADRSPASQR